MDKLNKIRLLAGLTIDPKKLIENDSMEIPVNISQSKPEVTAVSVSAEAPVDAEAGEGDAVEDEIAAVIDAATDEAGDDKEGSDLPKYEVGSEVTFNGEPMVVAIANNEDDYVGVAPKGNESDISAIQIVHVAELSGEGDEGSEDEVAAAEADAAAVTDEVDGDDGNVGHSTQVSADDINDNEEEKDGMSNIPENLDALRNQMDEVNRNMEAAGRGVYREQGNASFDRTMAILKKKKAGLATQIEAANAKAKKVNEKVNYYYDTKDTDADDDLDHPTNVADGEANKDTVWKTVKMKDDKKEAPNQLDHLGAASDGEQVKKVRVPAGVKSALSDAIKDTESQLEKLGITDIDSRFFYKSLAQAMKELLVHIEGGTVEDIKKAQIFWSTLMSPIMHKIPAVVSNFIMKGGETPSLKDLFKPVDVKYPITGPRNYLK